MGKVDFIEYEGKQILCIDFSGCSEAESMQVMDEAGRKISGQPEQSLYTLTNVKDMLYNGEVVAKMKEYTKANKPFVKAAAVIGLTRIKSVILNAVNEFSSRNLKAFDDEKKAKAWLVTQ